VRAMRIRDEQTNKHRQSIGSTCALHVIPPAVLMVMPQAHHCVGAGRLRPDHYITHLCTAKTAHVAMASSYKM